MNLKLKDLTFMTISTAIIATFVSTLLFWQEDANASRSAVAKVSGPVESTTLDVRQSTMESLEQRNASVQDKRNRLEAEESALNNKFSALGKQIREYLQQQTGTYGFFLFTRRTVGEQRVDKTIGYNQDERFKMASTYKVPVNLYLYRQVAQKKLNLDEKLVYHSGYYEGGTGSLQYKNPGGSYPIRQLSAMSIRQSDNVALNILVGKLGRENVSKFMQDLGGSGTPQAGTPQGTPKDLVTYMRAVYDFAETNPDLGNNLIEDLKNTIFQDRIRKGTPANVPVAHKIGNLGGVVNDVGIVYASNPYILAVMSKNVTNDDAAAAVVAHVSKLVWEAIGQ